jgi:hypothetical protein
MEKVTLLPSSMNYMLREIQDSISCLATLIDVKTPMTGTLLDAKTCVSEPPSKLGLRMAD